MRRRREALAVLCALASACTCADPPSPVLESIAPVQITAGTATEVSVRGSGFFPWIQVDLDAPERSTVNGAFALALVLGDMRVALEQVAFVSDRELSARIPPLAAPAVYGLELVDPRGRVARLPSAVAVEVAPGCGPDGTPCDDGNVCTHGDACLSGSCAPGPNACGNTAPRACLTVTPSAASAGDTVTLDASCSRDDDDPASALLARIDFEGDGSWDTGFSPVPTPWQHVYPTAELWTATVEVMDPGGLSDFASRYALVGAPGELVLVTTAVDEADPGASPAAPGGSGLSLREAIAHVNGLAAPRIIRIDVAAPMLHAAPLPPLTAPGAAIVGSPAAPLDFPGVASPCLTLDAPVELLLGATVTGCTVTAVMLGNSSAGSRVAECTVTPSAGAHAISVKASSTIGPRNDVSGAATGLKLVGSALWVEENRIHGNDAGISAVAANQLVIRRNRIVSNRTSGLSSTPSAGACTLLHNVFDANGDDGVSLAAFGGGLVAHDNLFTRNGGYGLRDGSPSGTVSHNGFFANGLGPLWPPGEPGPADLVADPRYAGDHRLAPGSPAIDRGLDAGLDVNGPAGGRWNGTGPDLGAWEAPYPAPAP